ncbi:MAG: D-alanyl-D-alanine carboxypeptidase family protein [Pseudomonadota bacterium]
MRTLQYAVMVCLLMLCQSSLLTIGQARADLQPVRTAPYMVVDLSNGKVISRNRVFVRWAPASLTKLMTAYTVFRAIELQHLAMNSPVRISEKALEQPPSKMGFPVGTILTIENALKILMVKSANDVSVALGEAVGGSEDQFVKLMNAHARRLGMKDTQFTNPHGLHDPQQYTNARDMAVLAIALTREFPQYDAFFDIPALRVAGRRLRNHNALLRLFEGTTGLKTGYVCASGFNVVVRTKRDGKNLAAIVFGHKSGLSRNVKAAEILTDAFAKNTDGFRPTINTIRRPLEYSAIPVDITRSICPGKYPATIVPDARPAEAPSAQDFDGIDTQVLVQRAEAAKNPYKNLPIPTKRPFHKFVPVTGSATAGSNVEVAQDESKTTTGPSLKSRAQKLLKPRKKLRKDVRISLGGAIGANPFGIKHTNGGKYKPPIPVPQRRPALDLSQVQE